MKKLLKKSILSLGVFALFFSSCEMNLYPSTNISNNGFTTMSDAEKYYIGLHTYYRATKYGAFAFIEEIQGDMFNASLGYGNNYAYPHQMDENFKSSDSDITGVWQSYYTGIIQNSNNFINWSYQVKPTSEADAKSEMEDLREWQGTAYLYRADAYFNLARRYTIPYEGSNITEKGMGLPLILEVDVTQIRPVRSTLEETFTQILKDLDSAKVLLADVKGEKGAERPTSDAVRALMAKVNFYMGDYTKALAYADTLIQSGTYPLNNTEDKMISEWKNDSGDECILQLFTSFDEGANTFSIFLGYDSGTKTYKPTFIPTQAFADLYEADDLRKAVWTEQLSVTAADQTGTLTLMTKFAGNPEFDIDENNRSYKHKPKVFRIAEMYLIAAESQLMLNKSDETYLQDLQAARGATVSTLVDMDAIKLEWKREMIGEGYVIDNLKRWNDGFYYRIPQNITMITEGERFNEIEVNPGYAKLTWGIPLSDIQSSNYSLVQNPGW